MLLDMKYVFSGLGKYAGRLESSLPHLQASAEKLQYKFNKASSSEVIELHGVLIIGQYNEHYLDSEFGSAQPIRLAFDGIQYIAFINKTVMVKGQKQFEYDYFKGKPKKENFTYLKVLEIEQEETKWALETPPITKITGYLNYLNFADEEEPTQAFILSQIGIKKEQTPAGIGLLAHIPQMYHPRVFEPFIKAYKKIDPFQGTSGDRISIATQATPETHKIIQRELNTPEVDYMLGARPYTSESITRKLLLGKAEVFTTIGEDGLNNPKYDKNNLQDVKYSIVYTNKMIKPYLASEAREEIEREAARTLHMIKQMTDIEDIELAEILANRKIEDVVIANAKANLQEKITPVDVIQTAKIMRNGLFKVLYDKDVAEILSKKSEVLQEARKPEESPTKWKRMEDIHERILIEIRKQPQTKEELWEKLKHDFKQKYFGQTFNYLVYTGRIYEKRGLFYRVDREI
ncbi:MAG TPA: hypothetical protein HA254_05945 [Candidatus Diapherotrites archaeon]|uniref:Uncharacterized protein n=1 Tax=Candidatus Iainarchaeum sp. TaxID=3101447 RepID=A0A7J4IXP1_9ARCH|nr:hypothetical protein [Candidatus Diapherotrites archaeon]